MALAWESLRWNNKDIELFKAGNPPEFMGWQVAITDISYVRPESATVRLSALLPKGIRALDISNGDIFEVVYREYGAPEDYNYDPDDVVFRLIDCVITEKRIKNVMPLFPGDSDIMIHVILNCKFEVNRSD